MSIMREHYEILLKKYPEADGFRLVVSAFIALLTNSVVLVPAFDISLEHLNIPDVPDSFLDIFPEFRKDFKEVETPEQLMTNVEDILSKYNPSIKGALFLTLACYYAGIRNLKEAFKFYSLYKVVEHYVPAVESLNSDKVPPEVLEAVLNTLENHPNKSGLLTITPDRTTFIETELDQ